MKFFESNLLAWWHLQGSSNLLFKNYFWFWLVTISSFSYKQKRYSSEIFECGGTHHKTDHFKWGVSLETLFNCHMYFECVALMEYLLCLNHDLWLKKLFFLFSAMVMYVTSINYVINLAVPFHWTFYFFICNCILFFGQVVWILLSYYVSWWLLTYCPCNFNRIAVENFVNFVTPQKLFCYIFGFSNG